MGRLRWALAVAGMALALGGLSVSPSLAAEFFVASDGTPAGDGSRQRPWNLATALGHPRSVKPGDTIWLRGGRYQGAFTSRLKGAKGAPITLRQHPGERAVIDGRGSEESTVLVLGEWTTFRDLEVTNSDPHRTVERPHGFFVRGPHTDLINLVIHDCGMGIGFWSECIPPAQIYGCILYYNGNGIDNLQHAIYTQNRVGTKRIVDNVFFMSSVYGLHAYGSSRAFLRGFHIEGNAAFNNGALRKERPRAPDILVGGGAPAERVTLIDNYTYHQHPGGKQVQLGYGDEPVNRGLVARGNLFVGPVNVKRWRGVTWTGNTIVGKGPLLTLLEPPVDRQGRSAAGDHWDRNRYVVTANPDAPLALSSREPAEPIAWPAWQAQTKRDTHSRLQQGRPTGVQVFVRPNRYEPGRAHVIVYNWDRKETIAANLDRVLRPGQPYRIVSVQDYFGAPVATGTYDGRPVSLSMRPIPIARPIWDQPFDPPVTRPEFEVFVVMPRLKRRSMARTRRGGNVPRMSEPTGKATA